MSLAIAAATMLPLVPANGQVESSGCADITQSVYRLVASGCRGRAGRFAFAAFKPEGRGTLITALHGVAGCSSIQAYSWRGAPAFEGRQLQIVRADMARDVAELALPSAPGFVVVGGLPAAAGDPAPFTRLFVYGFPYGRVVSRGTEVKVATPARMALTIWPLARADRDMLAARGSPRLDVGDFIDLAGTLLPGHSGGPLVDCGGQVVGIANGGLERGIDGRTWAVQWNRTVLVAVDRTTLDQLGSASGTLFAYRPESGEEVPAVAATSSGSEQESGTITIRGTGFVRGLQGRLNPILDQSGRTYIYADNIAIDGGQRQPVPFVLNRPFIAEDSVGSRFRLAVTAITRNNATIAYERLPADGGDDVPVFEVQVQPGAEVEVAFSDGTAVSIQADARGRARLERLKRATGDVYVTHPSAAASVTLAHDLRRPLDVQHQIGSGVAGSLRLNGNTGFVPGLEGRLNPVSSGEALALYADNIAIDGGKGQPVRAHVNEPIVVEDSRGQRFTITFISFSEAASNLTYRRELADVSDDVASFTVTVTGPAGPVSGAHVVVAFSDGTVRATIADAQGRAVFTALKEPTVHVFVAQVGYAAGAYKWDARSPLGVQLTLQPGRGSVVFVGTTGFIPGLQGRLNPHFGAQGGGYVYADNIRINGAAEATQPAHFRVNEPLTMQDARNATFEVTFRAITHHASLIEYRRISP